MLEKRKKDLIRELRALIEKLNLKPFKGEEKQLTSKTLEHFRRLGHCISQDKRSQDARLSLDLNIFWKDEMSPHFFREVCSEIPALDPMGWRQFLNFASVWTTRHFHDENSEEAILYKKNKIKNQLFMEDRRDIHRGLLHFYYLYTYHYNEARPEIHTLKDLFFTPDEPQLHKELLIPKIDYQHQPSITPIKGIMNQKTLEEALKETQVVLSDLKKNIAYLSNIQLLKRRLTRLSHQKLIRNQEIQSYLSGLESELFTPALRQNIEEVLDKVLGWEKDLLALETDLNKIPTEDIGLFQKHALQFNQLREKIFRYSHFSLSKENYEQCDQYFQNALQEIDRLEKRHVLLPQDEKAIQTIYQALKDYPQKREAWINAISTLMLGLAVIVFSCANVCAMFGILSYLGLSSPIMYTLLGTVSIASMYCNFKLYQNATFSFFRSFLGKDGTTYIDQDNQRKTLSPFKKSLFALMAGLSMSCAFAESIFLYPFMLVGLSAVMSLGLAQTLTLAIISAVFICEVALLMGSSVQLLQKIKLPTWNGLKSRFFGNPNDATSQRISHGVTNLALDILSIALLSSWSMLIYKINIPGFQHLLTTCFPQMATAVAYKLSFILNITGIPASIPFFIDFIHGVFKTPIQAVMNFVTGNKASTLIEKEKVSIASYALALTNTVSNTSQTVVNVLERHLSAGACVLLSSGSAISSLGMNLSIFSQPKQQALETVDEKKYNRCIYDQFLTMRNN